MQQHARLLPWRIVRRPRDRGGSDDPPVGVVFGGVQLLVGHRRGRRQLQAEPSNRRISRRQQLRHHGRERLWREPCERGGGEGTRPVIAGADEAAQLVDLRRGRPTEGSLKITQ